MMNIQQVLQNDDAVFAQGIETMYIRNKEILCKCPYVTTITCCFYLCHAPKSIDNIVDMVVQPSTDLIKSLINEVFGGHTMFYPKPNQGMFHNCKIFNMTDIDKETGQQYNIAIKCFTNGTLHITGVRKLIRAHEIAEMFCFLIGLTEGGSGLEDNYTIQRHVVQLINLHLCCKNPSGKSIDLQRLHNLLQEETQYVASYNNDRHSGVNVKYLTNDMVYITILIFDSGNIILCGLKSIEHFVETCEFILNFVEQNSPKIYIETPSILTTRRTGKQSKGNKHFDYGQYIILR